MRVSRILSCFAIALVALAFVALTARIATARERSKTAKTHLAINISGPVSVTNTTTSCPSGDVCFDVIGTLAEKKVTGIALTGSGTNSLCSTGKGKSAKTCCSSAGTETLTVDSDVLNIAFAGKSCENSAGTEESIAAKWTATGGTGEFASVTGGGSEKLSDDPGTGNGTADINGSLHD
jgi:hypothetical protein